jgi:hypothetical protein
MKIIFIAIISISLWGEWIMYGESPTFIYNSKTGEVFRYFEQNGKIGFAKLNYFTNIKLKPIQKSTTTPTQKANNNTIKLQQLQQTLMNNSLNQVLK